MKFLLKIKSIDYRHYICIAIFLCFLACSVFVFPYAFGRLLEAFRDFGLSIAFYFTELFGFSSVVVPSVPVYSKMPFELPFNLSIDWQGFTLQWQAYWNVWTDKQTFFGYFLFLSQGALVLSKVLTIVVPVLFIFFVVAFQSFSKVNNNYNIDTKPLCVFKKLSRKVYMPIKAWVLSFASFLSTHKLYLILWALIWAYNFNLFSIVIEAVAFYMYLVLSFDFVNIYVQIVKLLLDLSVAIKFIPLPLWLVIAFIVVDTIRKRRGYDNLEHFELKNRGFINERPIVTMICGSMGKGKTTASTDMALSSDIMIRDKAYELIIENDLKFPYFPWIVFENSFRKAIANGSVYNFATCHRFINDKRRKFEKKSNRLNLFMYDYKKYGMQYDNKLFVVDLWNVLDNYAQLYFLYILSCSYIQSNYSIRTDVLLCDVGNFPMYDTDFFKRDSRLINLTSRYSHILNYDALRLGKRLIEDSKKADYFEFGVIAITEIGKERGNNLELQELKKLQSECNQKNDLFNSWLKMCRHSATVNNYPFVKVFTDEQRPESWGADARDLCEIIHIKETSDVKLAMPWFFVEELVYAVLSKVFYKLYGKYRFCRGDNTLLMYLIKSFYGLVNNFYLRTYNTFGYKVFSVSVEDGTQDGVLKPKEYYILSKKIYSKRYSTDCFSSFFNEKALRSPIGLEQVPEFSGTKATFSEMLSENSYFFNDLVNIKDGKKSKEDVVIDIPDFVKKQMRYNKKSRCDI